MTHIYEIIDPRDGSVRYIGKANDVRKRFAGHMRENRRRSPLYDWIAKMRKAGLMPTYRIAMTCEPENWRECETKAIADARASGVRLLNVADGGDEPYCAKEVRSSNARKINQARKNDPFAERVWCIKKTLTEALRQGLLPDGVKAKMRIAAQKRPDLFGVWALI